jgi:signal transduction histidine kinase
MEGDATKWTLTATVSIVLAVSALAWGLMVVRRNRSVLDLWLCVVMQVWIIEVMLSSLLDAARFDLGFYVGRLYGLAASCFVLAVRIQDFSTRQRSLVAAKGGLRIEATNLRKEISANVAALERANAALETSERAARLQAQRLTTLIENLPFGVTLVGSDMRHEAFNRRFLDLFRLSGDALRVGDGFEKFTRHKAALGEFGEGDIEWDVRARIKRQASPATERIERERSDGTTLEVFLIPLSDGSFVIAYFDITDRKKRLLQTVRAQKLEAIGSLTGGIAHDFNNMLTVMIGNLDFLRAHLQDDARATGFVDDAAHAARQASDLTRRLLAFARQQTLDPRPVDVGTLIQRTATLLRRTLGDNIVVRTIGETDLWPAFVDEGQCEAAIVNLAVNARDAMPGGGELLIETRNAVLESDYAGMQVDVRAGDYIVVEVTDNGVGIPPENIGRIFEPFFSTKEDFRGTGLGLAMVYGFVKQTGGHISVYSEVGRAPRSVFTFRAPPPTPRARFPIPRASRRGRRGGAAAKRSSSSTTIRPYGM